MIAHIVSGTSLWKLPSEENASHKENRLLISGSLKSKKSGINLFENQHCVVYKLQFVGEKILASEGVVHDGGVARS